MSSSSPALRRFVKRALLDATAQAAPDRSQLAAAFDVLCDRLRRRLEPLFGATAIAALFARALDVTTTEFTWLAEVLPAHAKPCSATGMAAIGSHVSLDSLQEGLAAVLAHNIALLSEFIGDDFVLPLVQQAWSAPASPRAAAGSESDL